MTFNKTSAHPFLFSSPRFYSRTPTSPWLDLSNGPRSSPTRASPTRAHSRFDSRSHPHAPPQQRSAPHTPFLLARAPGKLPSSRPHPHVSFYFSLRYNSILFLLWDPPLAGHHGADRTTDGRGAVGPIRSRSSSTSSVLNYPSSSRASHRAAALLAVSELCK